MCSANQYSGTGAAVCSNCSSGYMSSGGSSSCVVMSPSGSATVSVTPTESTTTTTSLTLTQSRSVTSSSTATATSSRTAVASVTSTVTLSPSTSASPYGAQLARCPGGWMYYFDTAGVEGHDSCVSLVSSAGKTWTSHSSACTSRYEYTLSGH